MFPIRSSSQCQLCYLSPKAVTYEGTLICCVWNRSLIPNYEYQMVPKVTALMNVLAAMQSAQWCVHYLCLSQQGADWRGLGFGPPRDRYQQCHQLFVLRK